MPSPSFEVSKYLSKFSGCISPHNTNVLSVFAVLTAISSRNFFTYAALLESSKYSAASSSAEASTNSTALSASSVSVISAQLLPHFVLIYSNIFCMELCRMIPTFAAFS